MENPQQNQFHHLSSSLLSPTTSRYSTGWHGVLLPKIPGSPGNFSMRSDEEEDDDCCYSHHYCYYYEKMQKMMMMRRRRTMTPHTKETRPPFLASRHPLASLAHGFELLATLQCQTPGTHRDLRRSCAHLFSIRRCVGSRSSRPSYFLYH